MHAPAPARPLAHSPARLRARGRPPARAHTHACCQGHSNGFAQPSPRESQGRTIVPAESATSSEGACPAARSRQLQTVRNGAALALSLIHI
eukprot:3128988-Alexandrium_andersonii.AAC.1